MPYLITASLLNAWKYLLESEHAGMEEFLTVLHRQPTVKTEAMEKGDAFEAWARDNLPELQGAVYQASLSAQQGEFLLYGRIDFLKAGIVYDTKFTSRYEAGKYFDNPQTGMYLELVPQAYRMVYIVSNSIAGETIWREEYPRCEVPPIMSAVYQFWEWLTDNGLREVYTDKWQAR